MTSPMVLHGLRLLDLGWSPIPLTPGAKSPGIFSGGEWRGLTNWQRFCARQASSIEVGIWQKMPDCGVGLACRLAVGCDIDIVEDASLAHDIEQLARDMLGDTPLRRVGLWPKRLLVYRAKEPFDTIAAHPIEILANGRQFVAFNTHPETGKPYDWGELSAADIHISKLPAVTREQCEAFVAAALAKIPEALKPKRAFTPTPDQPRMPNPHLRGTYEAIASALEVLPNPELGWNDWVRFGLSIKAAVGEAGEPLFAQWSAKAQKNDPKVTAKTWKGFKPHSTGAGTIYYEAELAGWICPPELTMDAEAWSPEHEHPAAALLAKSSTNHSGTSEAHEPAAFEPDVPENAPEARQARESPQSHKTPSELKHANGRALAAPSAHVNGHSHNPPDAVPVPPAFKNLSGFIGMFVDHVLASARHPQPIFAVAAALCGVGVLAGRRYRGPTNLRTNPYIASIGESGAGKDHGRQCLATLIQQAGLSKLVAGSKLVSGAGLLSALWRHPVGLFQTDEFGQLLETITDKRAPKSVKEIWTYLTELSTSAASVYVGAEYAQQDERPRQDIVQPCAVVHATTTPVQFWGALQKESTQDGSLARWLLFLTDDPVPTPTKAPREIADFSPELVEAAKRIHAGAEGWRSPMGEGPSIDPVPYRVPQDEGAEKFMEQLSDESVERRRGAVGTIHSASLGRWFEHVNRVALLHAISENPAYPIITEKSAAWASEIVSYSLKIQMRDTEKFVSTSASEADLKRVRAIIFAAGPNGINASALTRASQFVGGRRRSEILADLMASEQVTREEVATGRRPLVVWRAVL